MSRCSWRALIAVSCAMSVATSRGTSEEGTLQPTFTSPPVQPEQILVPTMTEPPYSQRSLLDRIESLFGHSWERQDLTDEIETDRDSFTPATTIAPKGRFILETAYSFLDNRHVADTNSFPEFLLRYGLTDRIELRLGWNADIGGSSSDVTGGTGEGDAFSTRRKIESEYTLAYGIKLRVTDQDEWLPRSVLIIQGFSPTGGSPGTSTASELVATYAFGWTLPNRWQFDTSIRYGLENENRVYYSEWAPSAVLRVPLGEKLAMHIEYFGLFDVGKETNAVQHYISPGVRYLVTSNLEVGARVGWGLNDQSARFFTNVGIGWRF